MTKKRTSKVVPGCCPPKTALGERPLVSAGQAADLARLFEVFSSDTRLRILHALVRSGELRVTDLAWAVGMKPQAISNQLRRLAAWRILTHRREGNNILYRIADPCIPALLDKGLCLLEDAQAQSTLKKKV